MDFNSSFISIGCEQTTKSNFDDLSSKLDSLDKKVEDLLKEHHTTQKLLKRVLEEVKSTSHNATKKRNKILPQKPFAEAHDFATFEDKIQSSETKFNDLVAELQMIIASNSDKFVKMAWRKVFTDDVAQIYSWKGTKTKKPARALSVTTALRQAYHQKFPTAATDMEFERTTLNFFQHASNRLKKRIEYENKKNMSSVIVD
ncbi:uncharacterized protein LOC125775320 isoform X2 [Bactrocera dorsalis]|uniref:Uncharacterized protein LOC125775320 isoform X2 n=1 Tax=Bactrocera dorsalis TaxID=27457 RepID=A0ABM3IYU8_BACDO|nr:uncharacterized protein LOC125775320 isoform X2 [Bactrocera dorsalis]